MKKEKTTQKRQAPTRARNIPKMSKAERREVFIERMRKAREARAQKKESEKKQTAPIAKKEKTKRQKGTRKKTRAKIRERKKISLRLRRRNNARKRSTHSKIRTKRETTRTVEERERLQQAKRVLRSLKRPVFFPKAVVHTNKLHLKEIMSEIPEQALIEHWEAINELKTKGVEIRHTQVPITYAGKMRTIELDSPISSHARHFASRHGLAIRERRGLFHRTVEHLLG